MSEYADRVAAERKRRGIKARPKPEPRVAPKRKTYSQLHAGYDCIYRGPKIGETDCRSCNKTLKLDVFSCSVHGRCTVDKLPNKTTFVDDAGEQRMHGFCKLCRDKHEPTDSIDYPPPLEPHQAQPDAADPWPVGVTTARRADNLLDVTLSSLYRAGFANIRLFADPGAPGSAEHLPVVERRDNQVTRGAFGNYIDGLRCLTEQCPAERYLMVQDDILIARQARQWLDEHLWPADEKAPLGVVSLYTSSAYSTPHSGWQTLKGWRWGACAMVWPHEQAVAFLNSKVVRKHPGLHGIDNRIGVWLATNHLHAYFMTPSLVQHIGDQSAAFSARQKATGPRRSCVFTGLDADLSKLSLDGQATRLPDDRPPQVTGRGVTLITPTGDRHEAFRLCERWMKRQEFAGNLQWIVVDDGVEPTRVTLGQRYIRRDPSNDMLPSLNHNLLAALPEVQFDRVLIIEDDDWYGPRYIQTQLDALEEYDLVGETKGRYWNVETKSWCRLNIVKQSSLCRTGFTARVYPAFAEVCRRKTPFVDWELWRAFDGKKAQPVELPTAQACVSIKGMPGRRGYTWDSRAHHRDWRADADGAKLRDWIGRDADVYLGTAVPMVGVYTVSFGDMDRPRHPSAVHPGVGYICVTDDPMGVPNSWETLTADRTQQTPEQDAEQFRMLFHTSFSTADWSIYVPPGVDPPADPIAFVRAIDGDELELADGTLARRSTHTVWKKYEQLWHERAQHVQLAENL